MDKVRSADGTLLALDADGSGPAVVVVGGAFHDRGAAGGIAAALESRFTVLRYDRRGRGSSTGDPGGDPASLRAEVADLRAVLDHAGPVAAVLGLTTGGVLALSAAAAGACDGPVFLVEPPFRTARGPRPPRLFADTVAQLVAARRVDSAVTYYLAGALGLRPWAVDRLRAAPVWPLLRELAPSLPADAALLGEHRVPGALLRRVRVPVLAVTSAGSPSWVGDAARETARAARDGRHLVADGPPREPAPTAVADAVAAAVAAAAADLLAGI